MQISEWQERFILHMLAGGKVVYRVGRKGPYWELVNLPDRKDSIERSDKYNICIDGFNVRATKEQERTIRNLNQEQLNRFRKIMGDR